MKIFFLYWAISIVYVTNNLYKSPAALMKIRSALDILNQNISTKTKERLLKIILIFTVFSYSLVAFPLWLLKFLKKKLK